MPGALDEKRLLARLEAVKRGDRYVRELISELGIVSAGMIVEGFVEGIRLGLACELDPRIAYNVLQRAADAAALAIIDVEPRR